ncbi:MAG: class I SAM-dependent methyltransferase, partial [Chloroflexota bacterium]
MDRIRRHTSPGELVLDAGGGPGRYARELCHAGYRVVLCDVAAELLRLAEERMSAEEQATRARLIGVREADVRDLSALGAWRFDAALCLGPLTHLPALADRRQALGELLRVTRPGGVVILSVGGYLALLRTVMARFSDELLDPEAWELLQRGDARTGGGMHWHFFRAAELRAEAEACGLTTLEVVGCQGLSANLPEATNRVAEQSGKWQRWAELLGRYCADPTVADTSEHILYIGRTPA